MTSPSELPISKPGPRVGLSVLLFSATALVLAAVLVRPSLMVEAQQPVFVGSMRFFNGFLDYPGGLLEWAAAYVLQWHAWDWAGAVILAALLAGICGCARVYYNALGGNKMPVHLLLGAALLVVLPLYEYPWVDRALGLGIALGAAALYARVGWRCPWLRLGLFTVLAVLTYVLAAGQVLVFGACVAVDELLRRRKYWLGAVVVVLTALLPWLATWVYIIRLEDAYWFKLAWEPYDKIVYPVLAVFALPPVLGACVAWWSGRNQPVEALPAQKPSRKRLERPSALQATWGYVQKASWHPAFPVCLAALAILALWRPDDRHLVEISQCSSRNDFDGVLRIASKSGAYSAGTVADTDRALAHKNRLLDEMFAYPQTARYLLWLNLHESYDTRRCMKASDMLFEMGHVNKAERMAGEAMELNGYLPAVLERLAMANAIKGETAAARLFLNLLAQVPFHHAQAVELLRAIDADPRLSNREDLNRIREFMINEDFLGDHDAETIAQQALNRNGKNRLALQYFFAAQLIALKPEAVAASLDRLELAGVEALPRYCEETLLLWKKMHVGEPLRLGRYTLSASASARFEAFHQRFMSHRGNMEAARVDLLEEYGDTYWFFYMFGCSGKAMIAHNRGGRP